MCYYPENGSYYGTTATVEAQVNTALSDQLSSVFLRYRVGSDPTVRRVNLVLNSQGHYEGTIPFFGYNTPVHYYIQAQGSAPCNLTRRFPEDPNEWITYTPVHGNSYNVSSYQYTSYSNLLPFPARASSRSEFVYDSATIANIGGGPGLITQIKFRRSATISSAINYQRFQVRLANAPADYQRTPMNETFTTDMQIVYDASYTIPAGYSNTLIPITLQHPFSYAGGDLIVQIFYENDTWPDAQSVYTIPIATNKYSLYSDNPFFISYPLSNPSDLINFENGYTVTLRPWMTFDYANNDSIHDCAITAVTSPTLSQLLSGTTAPLTINLANFGIDTLNGAQFTYLLGGVEHTCVWTGTLAPESSINVTIDTLNTHNLSLMLRVVLDGNLGYTTGHFADQCLGNNIGYVGLNDYVDNPNVYFVHANSNLPEYGTVSGSGQYSDNTECILTATINSSYPSTEFVSWSDGCTDNPRRFLVHETLDVTAIFQPHVYTVIGHVSDIDAHTGEVHPGLGRVVGSGTYDVSVNASLRAARFDGRTEFSHWTDPNGHDLYWGNAIGISGRTYEGDTVEYTAHFYIIPFHALDLRFNFARHLPNPVAQNAAVRVTVDDSTYWIFSSESHPTVPIQSTTSNVTLWGIVLNGQPNLQFGGFGFDNTDGQYTTTTADIITLPIRDIIFNDLVYYNVDVFFNYETLGIDALQADDYRILTQGRNVTIEGADQRRVRIFDVVGRQLYDASNLPGTRFTLPAAGLYLIQVDSLTPRKLVVR